VWYFVMRAGVPLGTVELSEPELAAGRLRPLPGYESVRARVHAASRALFAHGLFGPPISALPDPTGRAARAALRSAAVLRLELAALVSGVVVPTAFVNLLEAPVDGGIVVIASFLDSPARVSAPLPSPTAAGTEHSEAAS
jgi:hypothetical protein